MLDQRIFAPAVTEPQAKRAFLLQRAQPALSGLIDGSLSSLAPIFSVALATHTPRYAFFAGLATAIGAGVSTGSPSLPARQTRACSSRPSFDLLEVVVVELKARRGQDRVDLEAGRRPWLGRRWRLGGPEGNEILTSAAAVVLVCLLVAEGITIVHMRGLMSAHMFIGLVLIPPVVLKLGSTGYRMVSYYAGSRGYRVEGPPRWCR